MKKVLRLSLVALVLTVLIVGTSGVTLSAQPLGARSDAQYAPDCVLVQFRPGVNAGTIAALHRAQGALVMREIPRIGVQVLRVPSNRVPQMVAAYSRNPNVLYAEPDYIAHALGDPDDEHFLKQWGLDNDGQEYKEGQSGMVDADIDAPEAWDIITGTAEIKIAILDTGIDQDHADLDGKLLDTDNVNFTDSGTVDDLYGHGTHVAGIAAAETNNTLGVAGIGYNSCLMNVKVLNDQASGYSSWIANGIVWAADNGAHVINMSLGIYIRSRTLQSAVNYAWDKGVVLAAAAGNDGTSRKLYPAAFNNCIAVAATDDDDQRVYEPGWWASNYGDWVDVAAPGLYIYSTFPNHDYAIGKSPEYDYGSGTSMATPYVAGLAGLLFGQDPSRTNAEVRTFIEDTADPIPGTGTYWTHGRINACKAVGGTECDAPADNPPSVTITNPTDGSTISGTVTVTADASDDDGVAHVEFFVDGVSIGVDATAPYAISWDTEPVADGPHTITATATDTAEQTASDSIGVTVDNVNDPPVASFSYSCTGLTCDFDGSGSSDPDGTIDSYDWDFGDGNTGSGEMTSHTYASESTYTVVLAVTDDDGATDTESQDVTVSEAVGTMHVGDLDGASEKRSRGNWEAIVIVTVDNSNHDPLPAATLSGTWSNNATTWNDTCTTGDEGQCTLTSGTLRRNKTTATFTVGDVTHGSLTYDADANHDPDGDSDGTTITVSK